MLPFCPSSPLQKSFGFSLCPEGLAGEFHHSPHFSTGLRWFQGPAIALSAAIQYIKLFWGFSTSHEKRGSVQNGAPNGIRSPWITYICTKGFSWMIPQAEKMWFRRPLFFASPFRCFVPHGQSHGCWWHQRSQQDRALTVKTWWGWGDTSPILPHACWSKQRFTGRIVIPFDSCFKHVEFSSGMIKIDQSPSSVNCADMIKWLHCYHIRQDRIWTSNIIYFQL